MPTQYGPWQYATLGASTLAAPMGSGDLSCVVASSASFSAAPFPLTVDNEVMWVTNVAGTTLTVVRAAEGPSAGSPVAHAMGAAATQTTTAASLPGAGQGAGFAPGTAAYNPAWYANMLVCVDHANASGLANDLNAGNSTSAPLLTIGEAFRRWGSRKPCIPGQVTTLLVMSGQSTAQATSDPYGDFGPVTPLGGFVWKGALAAVGGTFPCGSVTQISRANPGNDFQVAGMPGAVAPGQLLYNSTVGSYAHVQSVSGSVATCGAPFSTANVTTVTNNINAVASYTSNGSSWASGNTCQIYQPPSVYSDKHSFCATSIDSYGGDATGMAWVQFLNFASVEVSGQSSLVVAPDTMGAVYSMCTFDSYPELAVTVSRETFSAVALGCAFQYGCEAWSQWTFIGGSLGPTGHTSFLHNYVVLEGDVILDANVRTFGFVRVRNAHVVAGRSVSVWSGNLYLSNGNNYVAPAIWGAGTLVPYQNAAVVNVTFDTYVNIAKCALALTTNLLTTGTQFTAGTPGSWTSGVSLTAANLDTAPIQDPGSGARFC